MASSGGEGAPLERRNTEVLQSFLGSSRFPFLGF